jgi:hypothetical protein
MRLAHAPRAVEMEEDKVVDGAPINQRSKITLQLSTDPMISTDEHVQRK